MNPLDSQLSKTLGPAPEKKISTLAFELKRLSLFFLSLILFLCLLSHRKEDPSFSTFSNHDQVQNWMGSFGSVVSDFLLQSIGYTAYLIALTLFGLALKMPFRDLRGKKIKGAGFALMVVSFSSLLVLMLDRGQNNSASQSGGLLGQGTCYLMIETFGTTGSFLVSIFGMLVALMCLFEWEIVSLGFKLAKAIFVSALPKLLKKENFKISFPAKTEKTVTAIALSEPITAAHSSPPVKIEPSRKPLEIEIAERVAPQKISKPKLKTPSIQSHYQLPSLNLISGKAESKSKAVDKNWYLEKANILVQKLKDFGVEGEVVHISPGPVITVYEFKPASGVKIKEIANLSDDLTLALSVLSVRIVAPIPGKPVVGIEIPSPHRETVFFKDIIQETPFFSPELKIPIALGRLASGEPITSDLTSMPHLLIAGTTGTGKSVFINTLIGSLLFRFTADQLRLILVDPKMVELSHYEGIPHLLLPVVVDSKKAVLALRWGVEEMERRYSLMHEFGVRHVDGYNEKLRQLHQNEEFKDRTHLPYVVVVIDEYADLMAVVPKEVELSITRLAQKARASGIHLVLATQRPSTDVVTGTIKANFPSRISFRVASGIDAKTILDRTGSERLLGHGDLLFHSAGFSTLKRIQGPYISDDDTNKVVEFLKAQGEPQYDERILQAAEALELEGDAGNGSLSEDASEEDRLYDMAVRIVTEKGEASISLIQRHLRIGYNRAASLMERMESEGVVGGAQGAAKRRTVIVNSL